MTEDLACPDCGAPMLLRNSRYGKFYGCSRFPACKAAHGAHPDGRPLGIPANAETKAWRMRAHDAFDQLWKSGRMSRREAYAWLRTTMGLGKADCHIGRFDIDQCQQVIAVCRQETD